VKFILCFILTWGVTASAQETGIRDVGLTIEMNHRTAAFDPRAALGAGIDGHWEGETVKMFTLGHLQQMLGAGLGPVAVRLRTELAVEAWHWNPRGSWSDPVHHQGYWTSDATPQAPIILSYGYKLPRRGNTLDEANDDGFSMLDDGDPKTFWKSNPYLSKPFTGEADRVHSQWVVLDFGKPVSINSIRIRWGDPYARKFLVEYSLKGRVYFGGHPRTIFEPVWRRFPKGNITECVGGEQELRLSDQPLKAQYLRLWMTESSGSAPSGSRDIRDHLGYAIREISAGVLDEKGMFHDEVSHAPNHDQTLTYASSTDPWHRASDRDPGVEQPGIDLLNDCGITRGIPIMLAVPVFYDTPENAAALASYTRAKEIRVGRYELGEEPDGQRVAPEDFGALYAQSARAIRKAVPQGTLGGPSFVTVDVDPTDDTYRFDHRWWIRDFREELARQAQSQNYQFISFEWYPFDDVDGSEVQQVPLGAGMLDRAISRLHPLGLPLVIGEGNYSVFSCRQEVDLGGALLNSEMAAQFLVNGGSAMYFYSYEPNNLEESSGSWGNQMMLMQESGGGAAIPLASYYAMRLMTREWMNPRGGVHEAFAVKTNLSKQQQKYLSVFALKRPDASWSLLLINKDSKNGVRVEGLPFSGPFRCITYSAKDYEWYPDGDRGHPLRNQPPEIHVVQKGRQLVFPPWSIAVVRSEPISGKAN